MNNYTIFFFFWSTVLFAQYGEKQKCEITTVFSTNNLVSDVGNTHFINPSGFGFGFGFGWVINDRFNLLTNLKYNWINETDTRATEAYRKNRNKNIDLNTIMLYEVLEFNFFPLDGGKNLFHTPFVFVGVGIKMYMSEYSYLIFSGVDKFVQQKKKVIEPVAFIPFGIGYKYLFSRDWALKGRIMFNCIFSDNIDSSNPNKSRYIDKQIIIDNSVTEDYAKGESIKLYNKNVFGDTSNFDWFNIISLSLVYTFELKCDC
ncbi:DUF6089 family protein [Ichthyobacterium seriolicida]|uniref:DUF6089 domain-containing protein n=1 Tax=Ichthyobacterium seriolicida TaxID=242600 RepID=A0A1J1E684_9FLAO|nr:DUF6089 family protein [Ichthyobacterium seriolicida]BAV94838.1 hypothetical protein JBKA6_0825 [Ichthyobacterium seriolicida]